MAIFIRKAIKVFNANNDIQEGRQSHGSGLNLKTHQVKTQGFKWKLMTLNAGEN